MHPAPYLVPQKAEGGTYDLYQLPRETPKEISDNPESKRGLGLAACFVARNRFAVLDKNGMVYIRNLNNELTKTLKVPNCSSSAPKSPWRSSTFSARRSVAPA